MTKSSTTTNKTQSAFKRPVIKKEKGVTPKNDPTDDKSVIEILSDSNKESDKKKLAKPESSLNVPDLSKPSKSNDPPKQNKEKNHSLMLQMKFFRSR